MTIGPNMPDRTCRGVLTWPFQLCFFAKIALLGWLGGPVTLIVFAAVGFAGDWKAWRGGLARAKCWLRDTRLVLAYPGVLAAAGVWDTQALARGPTGF